MKSHQDFVDLSLIFFVSLKRSNFDTNYEKQPNSHRRKMKINILG